MARKALPPKRSAVRKTPTAKPQRPAKAAPEAVADVGLRQTRLLADLIALGGPPTVSVRAARGAHVSVPLAVHLAHLDDASLHHLAFTARVLVADLVDRAGYVDDSHIAAFCDQQKIVPCAVETQPLGFDAARSPRDCHLSLNLSVDHDLPF